MCYSSIFGDMNTNMNPQKALEDLQKAQWYLQREIMRIEEERLKKEFAKEN
jgi:hypothetical protein